MSWFLGSAFLCVIYCIVTALGVRGPDSLFLSFNGLKNWLLFFYYIALISSPCLLANMVRSSDGRHHMITRAHFGICGYADCRVAARVANISREL